MLSHDNFTWDAVTIAEFMLIEMASEKIVSFLPLSHVAAQVTITVNSQTFFIR
jgi:long-chain-fatty-acid--CoA ligase ACSBG